MKNLKIGYQGVKGGNTKQNIVGYTALFLNSDKIISVDNFKGSSDNYMQRVEPVICIFDGEDVVFEGTHEQLVKKLKA